MLFVESTEVLANILRYLIHPRRKFRRRKMLRFKRFDYVYSTSFRYSSSKPNSVHDFCSTLSEDKANTDRSLTPGSAAGEKSTRSKTTRPRT